MKITQDNSKRALGALALSMFVFGTIGIFRKYIPLPSGFLAMARGAIGALFLLLLVAARRTKLSWADIRRNFFLLCLSGILIGFNWILLFEAYRFTSVATATLCYYMAPIFVVVVSPALFKERLGLKKALCVIVALVGMVLVSGILQVGFSGAAELKGVALGLGAAVLYASVVLCNKKIGDISAYDKTIVQLASAAIVLIPYVFLTEDVTAADFTPLVLVLLLVVGIIHTGIAYALYFGSMKDLSAQTVALFSYIDPIVAVILSALFLREPMTLPSIIGAILVLGSTIVSELPEKHK